MTVIVYGDNKELFETDVSHIPQAITELYKYCGGRIGKELFSKIIEGLTHTGTTQDMVDVFDHNSCEMPIHKIYAYVEPYFNSEDCEDGN